MSEDGEMWNDIKKDSQEKRAKNRKFSTAIIEKWCKDYCAILTKFSESHLRINERFDFWPGTGKYIDRFGTKYKRGVFNLIRDMDLIYNVQKCK